MTMFQSIFLAFLLGVAILSSFGVWCTAREIWRGYRARREENPRWPGSRRDS